MNSGLLAKYNVPGPRYTSYPAVPHWDVGRFSVPEWLGSVNRAFEESNSRCGMGMYVHLPLCETPCTFCARSNKFTRNHGVESPYIQTLLREWSLWQSVFNDTPVLRELHLGGGTPTFFSPASLRHLCERLIGSCIVREPFEFGLEANPASTTEEHLRLMRECGFGRLSLGVQDLDPAVQIAINRIQTYETVTRVTDVARSLGFDSINFDLIYGLPCQTLAGLVATMEQIVKLRPDRIAFSAYAHVPWVSTASQRRFSEAEIPRGEQKLALYEVGRDLLVEAGYLDVGMDHFCLETDTLFRAMASRRVHRNFMGYTPLRTKLCVGLGMSAISDSWYGYAQNEKSLSAYSQRVLLGELPVLRGHLLDGDDLLLRSHILDLMCRFETVFEAHELQQPVVSQAIERLAGMQADGLVAVHDGVVRITRSGRLFLRNACMALDARLWRDPDRERRFSTVI